MAKPRMTMKILKEINELYDKGAIMQNLADKYNVSVCTIHRYVWNPRAIGKQSYITKELETKIDFMKSKKFKVTEIEKEIGIKKRLIYYYLEKQKEIRG